MTAVMIGIDPHKASHTAVAIDAAEVPLGRLRVRVSAGQVEALLAFAAPWPDRAWAVEGAGGLGYLLAQQLLAAGERVLDVQPKLGARVRLLADGSSNKNDPNDARSVAVAALRSAAVRPVQLEDHAAVMKVWAKRRRELASSRTQLACRLHAVLCELIPGGVPGQLYAAGAAAILDAFTPATAVAGARYELALEFVQDLRRVDEQLRATKKRIAAAVAASRTTTTQIFGVGPVVAATVIGEVGDIRRFPTRDRFAAYNGTAPIEVSSGPRKVYRLSRRGNRRLNHAIHMAAVTQIRHGHSPGRGYYDRKVAEGKTGKEALRALKRRISDTLYHAMITDARRRGRDDRGDPGGHTGNDSASSATGSHPEQPALRTSHSRATPQPRPRPAPAATRTPPPTAGAAARRAATG